MDWDLHSSTGSTIRSSSSTCGPGCGPAADRGRSVVVRRSACASSGRDTAQCVHLTGRAFRMAVMLQAIILIIMGAAQVGSAVGGARLSGILDFHRVSPLTPAELTLGFFFGAPIREYVLFAMHAPVRRRSSWRSAIPSVHGFVQLMIFLIAIAWVFHGLAILNSLIMKPRTSSRGVQSGSLSSLSFLRRVRDVSASVRSATLFDDDGRAELLRHLAALAGRRALLRRRSPVLHLPGGVRRMGSERIHPLSKPQAIAAWPRCRSLLLGGSGSRTNTRSSNIVALYLLVIAALLLLVMVTPTQAEYFKGLWRARKQGRDPLAAVGRPVAQPGLSRDRVRHRAGDRDHRLATRARFPVWPVPARSSPRQFPLAIAIGVLVVAYFGLAFQYFLLRFGGAARCTLVSFCSWPGSCPWWPARSWRWRRCRWGLSECEPDRVRSEPDRGHRDDRRRRARRRLSHGRPGPGDHARLAFHFRLQQPLDRRPPQGLQGVSNRCRTVKNLSQ